MIIEEELLSGPVAIEQVISQRPHYSQFFRWTEYGLITPDGRRLKLEYVKAGRKRLTSEAAVRRFFQAQTDASLRAGTGDSSLPITGQDESSPGTVPANDSANLEAELRKEQL